MKLNRDQLDAAGRMFEAACAPAINAKEALCKKKRQEGVKHYTKLLAKDRKYLNVTKLEYCAERLASYDTRFNQEDDSHLYVRELKTEFLDTLILADEKADIKAVMATFVARLK